MNLFSFSMLQAVSLRLQCKTLPASLTRFLFLLLAPFFVRLFSNLSSRHSNIAIFSRACFLPLPFKVVTTFSSTQFRLFSSLYPFPLFPLFHVVQDHSISKVTTNQAALLFSGRDSRFSVAKAIVANWYSVSPIQSFLSLQFHSLPSTTLSLSCSPPCFTSSHELPNCRPPYT